MAELKSVCVLAAFVALAFVVALVLIGSIPCQYCSDWPFDGLFDGLW